LDASTCRARASRNRDDVSDNIAGGASSRIDLASDYVGRRARPWRRTLNTYHRPGFKKHRGLRNTH
jgi:hypothetical protein